MPLDIVAQLALAKLQGDKSYVRWDEATQPTDQWLTTIQLWHDTVAHQSWELVSVKPAGKNRLHCKWVLIP